jgi:hypothetical protein
MNRQTEQLKMLRLSHAVTALEQQREQLTTYGELDFEQRLMLLLDSELLGRNHGKIERLK